MNYLDEYVNTYNKLHDECKGENSEELYCKLFKKYLDYKEYNHLSSLKCNLKEEEIQPEQLLNGKVNVREHTELNVSPGLRGANATAHNELLPNLSGEKTNEMGIIETNGEDTPPIASPTVVGIATIAGIVVPSYLAYNFTPARAWMNKLLGRKTNIEYNHLRDPNFVEHFSDPAYLNSERSKFDISYRPV
ncbi:unnamed protein product [Plasmodium vivax]|uniref:(malaria parasite P. vivax) hypothetical protein n=1 Tax=Plasmodium vivax TaxID=5855 RepID=A0A8S4HDH7_PLAVI|nr:unnamed protein product [Plasmodium vivax]